MKKEKKAVIYCRTASINDGVSELSNQVNKCIERAFSDGYKKCECFIEVCSGVAGKAETIKNLKSLKKRLRSQSVDALYITDLNRLTRNMQACEALLNYFRKYEVKVIITE